MPRGRPKGSFNRPKGATNIQHSNGKEQCQHCGKLFAKTYLSRHIQSFCTKSKDKRIPCKFARCPLTFWTKSHLDIHIKRFHSNCSQKLACPVKGCGLLFSKYNLPRHVDNVHKNQTIKCDKCNKSVKQSSFHIHKQCCYKIKQFECKYCRKIFTLKWNLQKHLKIHTDKAMYCPECNFVGNDIALQKHYMKSHIRKPRKYKGEPDETSISKSAADSDENSEENLSSINTYKKKFTKRTRQQTGDIQSSKSLENDRHISDPEPSTSIARPQIKSELDLDTDTAIDNLQNNATQNGESSDKIQEIIGNLEVIASSEDYSIVGITSEIKKELAEVISSEDFETSLPVFRDIKEEFITNNYKDKSPLPECQVFLEKISDTHIIENSKSKARGLLAFDRTSDKNIKVSTSSSKMHTRPTEVDKINIQPEQSLEDNVKYNQEQTNTKSHHEESDQSSNQREVEQVSSQYTAQSNQDAPNLEIHHEQSNTNLNKKKSGPESNQNETIAQVDQEEPNPTTNHKVPITESNKETSNSIFNKKELTIRSNQKERNTESNQECNSQLGQQKSSTKFSAKESNLHHNKKESNILRRQFDDNDVNDVQIDSISSDRENLMTANNIECIEQKDSDIERRTVIQSESIELNNEKEFVAEEDPLKLRIEGNSEKITKSFNEERDSHSSMAEGITNSIDRIVDTGFNYNQGGRVNAKMTMSVPEGEERECDLTSLELSPQLLEADRNIQEEVDDIITKSIESNTRLLHLASETVELINHSKAESTGQFVEVIDISENAHVEELNTKAVSEAAEKTSPILESVLLRNTTQNSRPKSQEIVVPEEIILDSDDSSDESQPHSNEKSITENGKTDSLANIIDKLGRSGNVTFAKISNNLIEQLKKKSNQNNVLSTEKSSRKELVEITIEESDDENESAQTFQDTCSEKIVFISKNQSDLDSESSPEEIKVISDEDADEIVALKKNRRAEESRSEFDNHESPDSTNSEQKYGMESPVEPDDYDGNIEDYRNSEKHLMEMQLDETFRRLEEKSRNENLNVRSTKNRQNSNSSSQPKKKRRKKKILFTKKRVVRPAVRKIEGPRKPRKKKIVTQTNNSNLEANLESDKLRRRSGRSQRLSEFNETEETKKRSEITEPKCSFVKYYRQGVLVTRRVLSKAEDFDSNESSSSHGANNTVNYRKIAPGRPRLNLKRANSDSTSPSDSPVPMQNKVVPAVKHPRYTIITFYRNGVLCQRKIRLKKKKTLSTVPSNSNSNPKMRRGTRKRILTVPGQLMRKSLRNCTQDSSDKSDSEQMGEVLKRRPGRPKKYSSPISPRGLNEASSSKVKPEPPSPNKIRPGRKRKWAETQTSSSTNGSSQQHHPAPAAFQPGVQHLHTCACAAMHHLRFECNYVGCEQVFVSEEDLRNHEETHVPQIVCPFPNCGKVLKPSAIYIHIKNIHQQLKSTVKCPYCGNDYKRNYLEQHIKINHAGLAK